MHSYKTCSVFLTEVVSVIDRLNNRMIMNRIIVLDRAARVGRKKVCFNFMESKSLHTATVSKVCIME